MPAFDGLGEALRRLRERRGWTQSHAEVRCGVGPTRLGCYESGLDTPELATLERILDAYGADVAELGHLLRQVAGLDDDLRGLPSREQQMETVMRELIEATLRGLEPGAAGGGEGGPAAPRAPRTPGGGDEDS